MTGKERLNAILNGRKADRICWTTISDDVTRSKMPKALRECSIIDFYRHIGCDVLQFGNHGLAESEKVTYPFSYVFNGMTKRTERMEDGSIREIQKTQKGELITILADGHPVKYAVETPEDLFLLLDIWSRADVHETVDYGPENYRVTEKIGDSGIFVPTLMPSPVQQLLEYDMGMLNFYYLYADYPDEVSKLISEMHRCRLKEYEYVARNMPFDIVIPIENTSTVMLSPDIYRKFSMAHMRDFTGIMHAYGKKSIIHMCGHVGNLLPEIKETGLDGIHALTEPPVGNCPFDKALDYLGDDLIIIGTLNSTIFQSDTATPEDIQKELSRLMSPRLKDARFVLWPVSDGLPTDLWRFEAVREWVVNDG